MEVLEIMDAPREGSRSVDSMISCDKLDRAMCSCDCENEIVMLVVMVHTKIEYLMNDELESLMNDGYLEFWRA